MAIQANQVLEIIWIVWLMSWVGASFWSDRAQKRATTMETWTYRAAMIAGGILLVPWIGQLLEKKPIWEVGRCYVCARGNDVGETFPDVVGTYLSRTLVVKHDHPQEGP